MIDPKDKAAADLWLLERGKVQRHRQHQARQVVAGVLRVIGRAWRPLPHHIQLAVAAGAAKAGRK